METAPPGPVGPPFFTGLFLNPAAGAGHSVCAHVERRPAGTPGDLGWERDSDEVQCAPYTFIFSAEVFWKGALRHVRPAGGAAAEYRLVLREFELFDTDREVEERTSPVTVASRAPMRERLVYLDLFPIATL